MPGYLASNALAMRSETGRSIDVYQTTLPSFCAAATRSGVTAVAGGAADTTRVPSALSASAPAPCSTVRRDSFRLIVFLLAARFLWSKVSYGLYSLSRRADVAFSFLPEGEGGSE